MDGTAGEPREQGRVFLDLSESFCYSRGCPGSPENGNIPRASGSCTGWGCWSVCAELGMIHVDPSQSGYSMIPSSPFPASSEELPTLAWLRAGLTPAAEQSYKNSREFPIPHYPPCCSQRGPLLQKKRGKTYLEALFS